MRIHRTAMWHKGGCKQTVEDNTPNQQAIVLFDMNQSITKCCETLAVAFGALLVNSSRLIKIWCKTLPLGLASAAQQAHQLRLEAWVQPPAQGCLALR